MKKYLFSTLVAAAAMAVPAWADAPASGSGTSTSPYSGSVSGFTDIFSSTTWGEGSTVYISGVTGYLGTSNTAYTCVANINIGSNGLTITNGYSNATYTFTGDITGSGNWVISGWTGAQKYIFTGDVSGYSGNFDLSAGANDSYLHFGNGGTAATNSNVSGTGSITVNGNVTYNYSGYASNESTAITIGNTSITATTVEFAGSVNYAVSKALTGYNNGGTLTISNVGHTTTLNGATSGFTTVTLNEGATLAVGSTGSLNLSGTTVNIGSTIQNSGTVTVDESTRFVIDGFGLEFEGDWSTGATYTLITNVGSGTITGYGDLSIDNVSSATSTIESATFSLDNGSLTLTVTGTFVLADGLHGDGLTASSAYFTTGGSSSSILRISFDASLFTEKGTTVYLATDSYALGNAYENIFWSDSVNAECDIVIGAAGIYLTNGTSNNVHTFSGKISGEGDWTVSNESSASVTQHYVFTGDMSGWSGNFTITSGALSYAHYGNGEQAATDVNVSGTGSISVSGNSNSEITFNYSGYAEEGSTAIVIGNESISAPYIKFDGSVNYEVKNITVAEGSTTQLTKSSAVTLTVSLTDLVLGSGATFTLYTESEPTSSAGGLSIGTVTINAPTEGGASDTSATLKTTHWESYIGIANLVGTDATLTLDSNSDSDGGATIFELGTSGNTESTSQFTGKIVLSDDASAGSSGTGHRAASLVISEKNIAAGAVIEFGTETVSQYSLSLGVNAETVEIAGLVSASEHTGGDIIYSGTIDMKVSPGNGGATLIDYKSEENKDNFTHVGTSRNTLVINTDTGTEYSFSGVFLDMLNLEKTGAGTQSITFQKSQYGSTGYYFDGLIAVKEGTLNLSGADITSSGITVDSGATLTINNEITLTAASDLGSCSSTISGTVTLGESGKLSVGAGATLTLNTALGSDTSTGTVEFASGAQLILTDAFLASAITTFDGEEQSIDIIMANSISFGGTELGSQSSEELDSLLADYVSYSDSYQLTWSYADGVLSAAVTYLPEPSMFGLMFGLGAIGLVATRRRRRAA